MSVPPPDEDDQPLDPSTSAALIAEQRARLGAATEMDGRLLFGVWGVAWLLGFAVLWASFTEPALDVPRGLAFAIFGTLLISAMVVTAVHIARKSAGVHGVSATQGAMYGWAWFAGFGVAFALSNSLGRQGVDPDVVTVVMTVVSCLVVGVLYMTGAVIGGADRTQFALGAWICLVTAIGVLAGLPHLMLIMSLAGGGGMLVAAAAWALRIRAQQVGAQRVGHP